MTHLEVADALGGSLHLFQQILRSVLEFKEPAADQLQILVQLFRLSLVPGVLQEVVYEFPGEVHLGLYQAQLVLDALRKEEETMHRVLLMTRGTETVSPGQIITIDFHIIHHWTRYMGDY